MRWGVAGAALLIAGCSGISSDSDPGAEYFERLTHLCDGQAYAGRLVSEDDADADFRDAEMTIGPATCSGLMVRIPFRVDDDRSRTWEITRTVDGIRLKHDHRHRDGSEDVLTQYGGDSEGAGTATRQDYPADD